MDSPPRGPDRKEVEAAFHALLEKLRTDPAASRSFLTHQPEELRTELGRMLADYRLLLDAFTGSSASLKSGRRMGEYELLAEIGRGGMGSVWEAEHAGLHRRVALKLLHPHLSLSPQALERFRREALAGARLSHPGIVTVYETGEDDGTAYLAMELVPGGFTLGDRIAEWREAPERGREHWRELAELFHGIGEALAYAHQLGVVHRDLKPGNILISEEGRPRIADFGLAKLHDELAMSRTGEMTGTPYYMSPEQAGGRAGDAGPQADVFALGVTLYEALTLQRPFDAESAPLVMEKILREDPRDPRAIRRDVPRELAAIALKALEKKPAARYAGAREMAEDLQRFLSDESVLAQPPGMVGKGARWVRRHPVWGAVVSLVAVAVVIFAWQFAEIVREQALTRRMLALTGRAARIIDPRGIGLGREDNLRELSRDVEELLPELERSPGDIVRLLTLRAQVLSSARSDGALEDFDRALAVLPQAIELTPSERANTLYLAGMERLRAYHMDDARRALGEALSIARANWSSKDAAGHWNDPRVLDVAAQYVLVLLRGYRLKELNTIAADYGEPESWMTVRWDQLKSERGDDDPAVIEMGLALARWYYDQGMIHGKNQNAKEIYGQLESAATARFGSVDPRTLEVRLLYLAAWSRAGMSLEDRTQVFGPRLLALRDEIEVRLGKEHALAALAQWRVAVSYLDVGETEKAGELYPEVVARMTRAFGPRHLDTYKAWTGLGIALAYVDPVRSADVLSLLARDMEADPEIGPKHEAACIALRALLMALQMLDLHDEAVDVAWAAFQARGGWGNLKDRETVGDLVSCFNWALRAGREEVVREILPRLTKDLATSLKAAGIDPSASLEFFYPVDGCLDAAWRAGRRDLACAILQDLDACRNADGEFPYSVPTLRKGLMAEVRGSTGEAETSYRRAIQEDHDPESMELLGLLLGRQGCVDEAVETLQLAIENSKSGIFHHELRSEIAELLGPSPRPK